MSNVIPIDIRIDRAARADARAHARLSARQRRLEKRFKRFAERASIGHQDLLEQVTMYAWRLVQFVPSQRRAELIRTFNFIDGELELSEANLKVVLISMMVIEDRYLAERSAA